jgi:flagellar M-ring protein FliF
MNYEISRSTARIFEPAGALSRVSVAVLVDGKYEAVPAKKKAPPTSKYVPRTPEELQKIEGLVKSAVGFKPERGDQVTVANIPFQQETEVAESGPTWLHSPLLFSSMKYGLIGLAFLIVMFSVIRPMMNFLRKAQPQRQFDLVEDHVSLEGAGSVAQLEMSRINQVEILEAVRKDPYQTAQVLQSWLRQRE